MTLVEIAEKEIGVREEGGNNCGARIRTYQMATWLKPDPWPWCAAFTAWTLQQWLLTDAGLAFLWGKPVDAWRCRDASAFGWLTWAAQRRLEVLPPTVFANVNDFVVFDFNGPSNGGGHIGVVAVDSHDEYVTSIDGNTNGAGDRESTKGDGVWKKRRHNSLVKGYIRLGPKAP